LRAADHAGVFGQQTAARFAVQRLDGVFDFASSVAGGQAVAFFVVVAAEFVHFIEVGFNEVVHQGIAVAGGDALLLGGEQDAGGHAPHVPGVGTPVAFVEVADIEYLVASRILDGTDVLQVHVTLQPDLGGGAVGVGGAAGFDILVVQMSGAAIEGEGADAHFVHFGGQFLRELGGVGVVEAVDVLGDPGAA